MENVEFIYGLSPMQEGMLFHTLLSPDTRPYFEQGIFTIRGKIQAEHFDSAWRKAVEQHACLRTSFYWKDLDKPVQVVHRRVDFPIQWQDWTHYSEQATHTAFAELLAADRAEGCTLSKAPLMRLNVIQCGEREYRVLFSFHHLLLDAWSLQVLLRSVMFYYDGFCKGREVTLEQGRPYRDYISWLQQQDLGKAEFFWRQELKGIKALSSLASPLPLTSVAPEKEYVTTEAYISSVLSSEIRALAARNSVTVNTVLQAAWAMLVSRYTGQDDVLFGTTVSGRPAELTGVENIVGLFINTLPSRFILDKQDSLMSWLKDVQARQQEAMKYQYSPLTRVQTWSDRKSLFDHLLVFEGIPDVGVNSSSNEESLEFEFDLIERTGYPLTITIQAGDQISIKLTYSQLHFEEQTLRRMLAHYEQILQQFVANPKQNLAAISLSSIADEKHAVTVEWNQTKAEYAREKGVAELFEEQVARTPKSIAVEFESRQWSYEELNRRSNHLAHYLQQQGIGAETLVGICLERGLEMMVALLGTLKAGAAYVPLDPGYPAERIGYVLEDAQAAVLLSEESLLEQLPGYGGRIVALDQQWEEISRESGENPQRQVAARNLAYVIYTSGSTGKPKGVQIEQQAVVNFLTAMTRQPQIRVEDVLLAVTTLSFDIAGLELYLPLVNGARVRIASREVSMDGRRLRQEVERGVTVLQATPASWLLLLEAGWQGSGKLKVLCGGEALSADLAGKLVARSGSTWNMYGPTETTIWSLVEKIEGAVERVAIGRPIANTEAYVLDEEMEPVPVGVAGELYIGGDGLARGYFRRSELTAERFVPSPFSAAGGERLYRTGDLARYQGDGKLECLGRIDQQVKIRGYRIELGEIEAALQEQAGVKQAVVVAGEEESGQKRLVGYVVSREGEEVVVGRLREELKQRLPEYMVPGMIVKLESLPLTPNGKIDRKALPAPQAEEGRGEETYIAPRTPMEEIVAGIWGEVLKVERVGAEDNFFELGGHSLLATRVMSRVRKSVGVELPLKVLFEGPTVAALAAIIENALQTTSKAEGSIPRADRSKDLPLSFAQQRLWFMDKLEPESSAYNMPFGVRLKGKLNKPAMHWTFNEIVRRHEVLRTRFPERDGVAVQEVVPGLLLNLEEFDLRSLPQSEREVETTRIEREDANQPFSFQQAPLLRVKLVQLEDEEHVLLTNMHHIVSDGWSLELLMREFAALYEAACAEKPSPLPELEIQYADYSVWQRNWLRGEVLEEQIEYWRKTLDGVTALDLPADHPRPAIPTRRGGDVSVDLGAELSERIKRFSQGQGVTVFMTLLAGFQILLARYSGQQDIVVGTDVANRNRLEIEPLVGFFVNQLVLRTHVDGEANVAQLLQEVRKATLGAYAHQDVPFEKIVEELHIERNISREPLFQVKVVMQNAVGQATKTGGLEISRFGGGLERVRQDLELDVAETPDGIKGFLHYARDLFDHWRMEQLVEHYKRILDSVVSNPQEKVSQLALLSDAEQQRMLLDWNQTQTEVPQKSVHQLFEQQASRTPENIALVFDGQEVTYRELNQRANKLAHYLQKLNVGPGTLVGICMERSLEMMIGLLGVLKAGGTYVPLDASYPIHRLRFMIDDSQIGVLLTLERLLEKLPENDCAHLCLDSDWKAIAEESEEDLQVPVHGEYLAYVIYTSGSTGKPKGVSIAHRNVVNFFEGMDKAIQCGPEDTLLAVTGISFDISVLELFWTLTRGAKVVLVADPFKAPGRKAHSAHTRQLDYSLFYFSSADKRNSASKYRLLMEGARYGDQNGFKAIWTPERHFHEFGGLYPNPAVTGAAVAVITERIQVRAGSVVLPLHNVVRVAEEWSVVDNLSGGRTGLAFASGWHANDFVLSPENYAGRRENMFAAVETFLKLWHGESIKVVNGSGKEVEISIFPSPIQQRPPIWITAAGTPDTFARAGKLGLNVLTHLLGQTLEEVAEKIKIYRDARAQAGHNPESGEVALMLHTFIGDDKGKIKDQVRAPFTEYLRSSADLIKNLAKGLNLSSNLRELSSKEMDMLLSSAFERYFETSALFGTVQSCAPMIEQLQEIGVTEVACLIDFGIETDAALNGLNYISALQKASAARPSSVRRSLGELALEHNATLMQCTPSMMRMLAAATDGFASLRSLKTLMLGGESLPPALAREIKAALPARLVNMYGPTETTIWSSSGEVSAAESAITIGRPIANTEIYILDGHTMQPVPVGVTGELFIGGKGVARGYLNRPELTAEKFIPDVFSGREGSRLYGTGDLARYMPDGRIELLGRNDHQVKIRGFRIELGEIETALGCYPGVRDAAVIARESLPGEKRLIAYVVPRQGITPEELKEALRQQFPEYMVPPVFVMLDELPLTPNGKIDRRALPAPATDASARRASYVAPQTETEHFLAEIWQDVLNISKVGIEDNFFDLGGHSLLLVQVHRKISTQFEVRLVDLFTYPTISALAQYLERAEENSSGDQMIQERALRQLEAFSALQEITTR